MGELTCRMLCGTAKKSKLIEKEIRFVDSRGRVGEGRERWSKVVRRYKLPFVSE